MSWLWALVGIYCVGPTMMLAAGAVHSPPLVAGDAAWLVAISLLPPMTPWLALLNGVLEAVLLVTAVLLIFAARQYDRWRSR